MIRILHRLRAFALGFAFLTAAALPAIAAPGTPRIVGTATQVSSTDPAMNVATSGAINAGDLIVVIAASELNMDTAAGVSCGGCAAFRTAVLGNGEMWPVFLPAGKIDLATVRSAAAFARNDLAAGTSFQVRFTGGAGAKSVVIVAISGASEPSPGKMETGVGTAVGWSCTTNCSIAANLMMLSASMIPGGGSDSYTEDAAWTFLHQTAAGAWPTIRLAYKASGAGGTFSYGLTNGTSRSWLSGALLVK